MAAYSAEERRRGFDRVAAFARRAEFAEDVRLGEMMFWGGRLDLMPEKLRRQMEADEQAGLAFLNFLLFDLAVEEDHDTLVARFLPARGTGLSSGERTYLERIGASCLRLYEVHAIRVDEGLDLEDLWTRQVVSVRERLATRQLARWDLLAVRVIEGPDGVPVVEGVPYLYPRAVKPTLLSDLRRHHRRLTGLWGKDDPVAFFKRMGVVFHLFWLDYVVNPPVPTILTAEGDRLSLSKVVFDLTDPNPARVAAILASHPDLDLQDDGSYVWLEPSSDPRRVLGTLIVGAGRLTLEVISETRAERGRALIEALLGDAVRFRATVSEDLKQALERAPPRKRAAPVPADIEREVVSRFYEEHYRSWLDESLPALGGLTPRRAAQQKGKREAVVDLLKGLENQMERELGRGRPAVDVGWMWAELGLKRP